MSASGVRLAIRYGYVPCQVGLCGPGTNKAKKIIADYLKGKKCRFEEVRKILESFKGAYSYYRLIADANEISDFLDKKVVEAYWTGNNLLEKVSVEKFREMMGAEFLPLGKMRTDKIKKLPKNAIAFHAFHVLFIGSVTGKFQATEKGLDICRPGWGKILAIKKDKIIALCQPINFDKKIKLGKSVRMFVNWNKNILPDTKVGDWVSIHWNTAIEKLNSVKLKNIKRYTNKTLKIINKK